MDEKQIKQVKDNLDEIKEYAERFPDNAGWKWVVESVDKTLLVIDPEEEKVDEGFDMPKKAEKIPEPEPKPEPEPEPEVVEVVEEAAAVVEEPEPEPEPTDGSDVVPVDLTLETKDVPKEE